MLKSNRSEQSRYYGDFRGVDFSTDHTLVSERRFPYLVNMYKDYAAGAGQGIETIPGFRRRFVAPNGGKVHGIHSYKDKGGKRRVYVHAGDSLYDWKTFPADTGFSREVRVVAKDYDEYSSSIEGVGIAEDYVKAEIAGTSNMMDIRAIRKLGAQKWISAYPRAVYPFEGNLKAMHIPNAYTFVQKEDDSVVLKIPKAIMNETGDLVNEFVAGDTVEVAYYNVTKSVSVDRLITYRDTDAPTLREVGVTALGERIIEIEYGTTGTYSPSLAVCYSWGDGGDYTGLSVADIPAEFTATVKAINAATKIAPIVEVYEYRGERQERTYLPLECDYLKRPGVYVLYGGEEPTEQIDPATASFYQYDIDGNKVILPSVAQAFYYSDIEVFPKRNPYEVSHTVLEFDEYEDLGQSDYVSVDASGGGGLGLLSVRKKVAEGDEYISDEDYRVEGKEILFKKGVVNAGDEIVLTFGHAGAEDDTAAIYDAMNERESTSFVFGERLYILDGKKYLYIDDTGVHRVADNAYVPTTYINIVVGGENADAGAELEPRNMLSPYFKNTFIPDGETMEYHLNEKSLKSIAKVTAFDETLTEGEDYTVDLEAGTVKFSVPPAPPAGGAHVEIGSDGLSYVIEPGDNFYSCNGLVGPTEEDSEIVVGNYHNSVRVKALVAGKRDGKSGFGGNLKPMKTLDVSPGILSIRTGALHMCIAKNIILHEGLEHIYTQAFMSMSYIKQLTIPSTVKEIDFWAFFVVPFETVTFLGKPAKLDENAFFGCDRLKTIKVPWKSGEVPGAPWGAPEEVSVLYEQDPGEIEPVANFGYPELYAGVEITAEKAIYPAIEGDGNATGEEFRSMIETATIATVFDNRVFFSGVPSKPNFIFWSSLKNPSYIGILNYQQDGIGTTPITAMVPVANSLLVLKGDTEDGGAAFYHTPVESGIDVMAKSYPSSEGLAGVGCLGAACNFLDDPVYISRLGLEAIGYLSLQNERSREHRSSLVDAKLVNAKNLASARMCEWAGYLVLLVDGKIFLADSRQKFADATGAAQYEWYYLEDIGVFEGQYDRETYINEWPELFRDENGERLRLTATYEGKEYTVQLVSDVLPDNPPTEVTEGVPVKTGEVELYGNTYYYDAAIYSVGGTPAYAFLCDGNGEKIGGTFCPAVEIKTIDDNIFFGTTNGVVCSFNFDKRGSDGAIPADDYTFDGRAIYSGCALKMDNCGIPHMTKTTVKKSTVVKAKSFMRTAAKVRVRTNKNPFNEIARINGTRFSFEDMDFSDFSFVVGEDTLFAIREKEKKWVEKQYFVYSDEYKKPFALYYLAYKYYVAGKYKG